MIARTRHGFALLVSLWIIAGFAVLATGMIALARRAVLGDGDRVALTRARWRAEGCAAQVRAAIDETMEQRGPEVWGALDSSLLASPASLGDSDSCQVELRPIGARLDINAADAPQLHAVLDAARVSSPEADSLVDALLDWRDPDDVRRPLGAEREDYRRRGRPEPRNGPFADIRELRFVRSFDQFSDTDSLLDVEPGRIVLDRAPAAVLAALPGFGDEVVARVMEMRVRGEPVGDLSLLATTLSPAARGELLSHLPELASLTTTAPESWLLTASASAGVPTITVSLEERLALAGSRVAIARMRITAR